MRVLLRKSLLRGVSDWSDIDTRAILTTVFLWYVGSAFAYSVVITVLGCRSPTSGPWEMSVRIDLAVCSLWKNDVAHSDERLVIIREILELFQLCRLRVTHGWLLWLRWRLVEVQRSVVVVLMMELGHCKFRRSQRQLESPVSHWHRRKGRIVVRNMGLIVTTAVSGNGMTMHHDHRVEGGRRFPIVMRI